MMQWERVDVHIFLHKYIPVLIIAEIRKKLSLDCIDMTVHMDSTTGLTLVPVMILQMKKNTLLFKSKQKSRVSVRLRAGYGQPYSIKKLERIVIGLRLGKKLLSLRKLPFKVLK